MRTVTLIIDKRLEISTKYKKALENDFSTVIISKDILSAMKFIQDKEPDLIIISDSIGQDLDAYCREIRALTYNMRPIIIATSKSSEISDKLKVLESGADDFISEPINSKEFIMRIKAHLRREFESNLDDRRILPNRNYSLRAIKRLLSGDKAWAAMLISIDNFKNYREVYTKLASDKLAQTYIAIMNSVLSVDDFLGSLSENEFLIITEDAKAEKMANFLTFAFDTVSEKFYSSIDVERGFLMTQGDSLAGKRSEFVHSTIGIITSSTCDCENSSQLINNLVNLQRLAKLPNKSNFLMERTKLEANDSVIPKNYNNKVLIIEQDEAMTLLLSTVLNIQGYETKVSSEFRDTDFNYIPAVIILDEGNVEDKLDLSACKIIKDSHIYKNTKLIVTSVYHDKGTILKAGADLYLPKPYDVANLVKCVEEFIKEVNF